MHGFSIQRAVGSLKVVPRYIFLLKSEGLSSLFLPKMIYIAEALTLIGQMYVKNVDQKLSKIVAAN